MRLMIHKLLKGLAPVAALAASAMLTGCNVDMQIGDGKGVPLAELDRGGDAPTEIILAGPDTVIINTGETFDIDVSGDDDAVAALRFHREDSSLAISREKDSGRGLGSATVRVTVPSLTAMVLAGSGTMEADEMTGSADVTIAGSGTAKVARMEAEKLDMTIAGSGDFEASGTADRLDMTVAGSGSGKMEGLKVERADITIAGSGNAAFASDGRVEASIVGSGDVSVTGSATCEVSAMGSGKLRCSAGTAETAS
ncbi:head GIN domain-containing protein [Qipengyuania aquimaris]|uniref:head GIN domain-containing protein n=1 Tax=Qipengyuania aquimaris TaxID=255984 RepID=UPI0021BDBF87|nr:head GIN domain-containing protein [Qipengyuania aquimaris]